MNILLDECLPIDLRHEFPKHHAHTVEWAGLKGKNNGELLGAAEAAGCQVLLTIDRGIAHQQPHGGRKLAILLLHSRTNQIEDLLPLVDPILIALEKIQPGQIVSISSSDAARQ